MQNVIDTVKTVGTALGGSATLQVVNSIDPSTIQTVLNIVFQIAIGVATLWGLLRKKKPQASN